MKFQPVIKWTGSKRGQSEEIIKRFPKSIETYYEPFIGGGSVLFQLLHSDISVENYICSDINEDLINLWNMIKNNPNYLCEKYKRDYNEIRDIIIRKYNKVYKDIDPKKVDYKKVIEELYHINGFVNDISVKKQSIEKQKGTIRRIDKLIQYLESKYE